MAAAGGRKLASNMVFGAISTFWRAALQLIFIPIYLYLLGPEFYGLVAFHTTLLMLVMFLESAVNPVVVREFGRMGGEAGTEQTMRDLLRSLELVSVCTALVVGAAVISLSGWIAESILTENSLDVETRATALILMGAAMAAQWPVLLYGSAFIALHRQGLFAALTIATSSFRFGGTALVIWITGPDIETFFWCQIIGGVVSSLVMAVGVWRIMPHHPERPRIALAHLRRVFGFAMGTLAIGLTASLLTQADKLIVSAAVSLETFTAYAMAFMLCTQAASLATAPVGLAVQPHLSKLAQTGEGGEGRLAAEYHRWTQVLWLVCLVVQGSLAAFPEAVLSAWLGSTSPLIGPVSVLLPIVAVGTMLNTLMAMPFMLQMAHGWVRLSLIKNLVALAVILPALLVLVPEHGAWIGAILWVALNAGYLLIEVPLMHSRLLRGEMTRWLFRNAVPAAMVAAAVLWVGRTLMPTGLHPWIGLGYAALVAGVLALSLLLVLPLARADVVRAVTLVRQRFGAGR